MDDDLLSEADCERCGEPLVDGGRSERAVLIMRGWPEEIAYQIPDSDPYGIEAYHERHFPDLDALATKPESGLADTIALGLFGALITALLALAVVPAGAHILDVQLTYVQMYAISGVVAGIELAIVLLWQLLRWIRWWLSHMPQHWENDP